jgi:polar amino acid transport system substrate-binding protein
MVSGIFALLMICFVPTMGTAAADESAQTVRVATRTVPPLVVDEKGKLTGFSIELWNTVAERLKLRTTYQVEPDVVSILDSVRNHKADLGIAAISITADRDREYDFSLPILDAGLQILVRGAGSTSGANPLEGFLRLLLSPVLLVWLGIAAVLIIVPAHVVWWLERDHKDGMIPDRRYIPGIFHAMWWSASTLATQAEQMPKHWIARVLAVLWMFVGVVFVAYYTAQLTASLTVQEIRGAISGPQDLPGKTVGTTRGSTAAAYLDQQNAKVVAFGQIEEAYQALIDGKVEAVVFDAPVLLSYAAHEGSGLVRVVGPVFRKENYGIVFEANSPLRRRIDAVLLTMREDGSYDQIYDKWFTSK